MAYLDKCNQSYLLFKDHLKAVKQAMDNLIHN